MADKQFEYRIKVVMPTVPMQRRLATLWFRSTNYMVDSAYGWNTLSTTYPTQESELVAAAKQLWGMHDCEFIPARPETIETMFTEG